MAAKQNKISARERVYNHLRDEMHRGAILPGNAIDLVKVEKTLKISSTPMRDALIRLEAEGFVTIHPRSKVVVNILELDDFDYLYSVMGAIESSLIINGLENYSTEVIARMRRLNREMESAINNQDMQTYDQIHYIFHEVFLEQQHNLFAERIISSIKNRLWDFPRKNFLTGWYHQAIEEHKQIINAIEEKDPAAISHQVKNIHWGYALCKEYIKKEYNLE